ncbi:OmpA family protein [Paraliomyxa miuraensis]|uniref:OmpA family protein n=1 Tax=Paraliomyxa miuraensis TaxID=376150 RepID=UPI00224DD688|nr:OmpA family protein [Paraliomyxa miuraensis]MCX4241122.1 OmpA family protein [Paraliomyxa miuraensis]
MRPLLARLAPFALLALPLMMASAISCKPDYPQCKKDKHCKVDLGEKCVDGSCQNCTTDADCTGKGPGGTNWVCHEFRCTDPAAVPADGAGGPGSLGSPCTQTIDCSGGLVCTAGKCSQCTDDIECNGGTCDLATGTCMVAGGGGSCTTDDQCAMDEICDGGMCVFSDIGSGGANPCGLDAVYFGFDSPKIEDDAAQQLRDVAECLKNNGGLVYLEAHADTRGTEEYNIMLTDKRGQTVKKFLEDLGVTGENMQVISKGSLEATGTDEAGMKQDRRVEFVFP